MKPQCDVFFSYRRKDLSRATPLLGALAEAGVSVWRDEARLEDHVPITAEIRRAIAESKALIAFYSIDYPLSEPCRQELTAAWIAAGRAGDPPYARVLILNPEKTFDHVPRVLAEQQSIGWPRDPAGFSDVAARIRGHVERLTGTLDHAGQPAEPMYHGMAAIGSPRFVGRAQELWELHGAVDRQPAEHRHGRHGPDRRPGPRIGRERKEHAGPRIRRPVRRRVPGRGVLAERLRP
jgi:TIR domain